MLEHLALGEDEGEVEAHRRGRSQVLLPEANIADLSLTYRVGTGINTDISLVKFLQTAGINQSEISINRP